MSLKKSNFYLRVLAVAIARHCLYVAREGANW